MTIYNNKKANTSIELSEWAQSVVPGFVKSLEAAEKAVHVSPQSNSGALGFHHQKPPLTKEQKEENVGLLKAVNKALVAAAHLELDHQQSFEAQKTSSL